MDSDSDSDLDVLAKQPQRRRDQLDERTLMLMGENSILRSRLAQIEQQNRTTVAQLLKQQTESEQKLRTEAERFRKLYEAEQYLHLTTQQPKRVKVEPEVSEWGSVVDLLLHHQTPLRKARPTLEVLFGVQHSSSRSIGHFLLESGSAELLLERLLMLLEPPPFSSDLNLLYLSIAFDLLERPQRLSPESCAAAVNKLTNFLELCVVKLRPLPSINTLGALILAPLFPLRLFNYVLAAIDVLLANGLHLSCVQTNVNLTIPVELAAKLAEHAFTAPPHFTTRLFDLLAQYANKEFGTEPFAELLSSAFGQSEFPSDRLELLCCGLRDATSAQFECNEINARYARLASTRSELPALRDKMEQQLKLYKKMVAPASLRFASALQRHGGPPTLCDGYVLQLLACSLESFPLQNRGLIHACMQYLWTRPPRDLSQSLKTETNELCVCLAKLQALDLGEPERRWAADILRVVAPPQFEAGALAGLKP